MSTIIVRETGGLKLHNDDLHKYNIYIEYSDISKPFKYVNVYTCLCCEDVFVRKQDCIDEEDTGVTIKDVPTDTIKHWIIGLKNYHDCYYDKTAEVLEEYLKERTNNNTTQTIKEEDNKNMEIVELYKNKKLKEIEDKRDKAIAKLKDTSTDYQEVLKLKNKYDIVEINLVRIWNDILNDNDKMVELYKGIIDEAVEAVKTLNDKIMEVNAMLEICETYEQKIEVLKAHDIIGEDLKLKD